MAWETDPALAALFGPELELQKQARQNSEAERRELLLAARSLLDQEAGQRFLWWLLERSHVFRTSFTGNSNTFFLEGERNIGLQVFALCLEAEPDFLNGLINFKQQG